jgi:hypothetical protein
VSGEAGALAVPRLTAPLRRLVARAASARRPEGLAPAVDALRAFIDRPSPGNFLAATRCLRAAARQQKLARLTGVAAPRLAAEHLGVIVEAAGLPAELRALLATLPTDAGTTRRFAVIAQLLTAHRLLAAHAEAAQHALQEHLGQPVTRAPSVERRRGRR